MLAIGWAVIGVPFAALAQLNALQDNKWVAVIYLAAFVVGFVEVELGVRLRLRFDRTRQKRHAAQQWGRGG